MTRSRRLHADTPLPFAADAVFALPISYVNFALMPVACFMLMLPLRAAPPRRRRRRDAAAFDAAAMSNMRRRDAG